MEVECQSDSERGRQSYLDMEIWMGEREECGGRKVMRSFFRKPMATPFTMMAKTAHTMRMKRTVHSEEVKRVILNCSQSLPWEEKAEHLSGLMSRMKSSGYDEKFRSETLNNGLANYKKLIDITWFLFKFSDNG